MPLRTRPRNANSRRGNSIVHVVIAVAAVGFVVLILIIALGAVIMLPALGKARQSARQLKDATQVRGIHQAMVTWAGSNKDSYPLPSQLDRMGATVAPAAAGGGKPGAKGDGEPDPQRAKDTTANIYSVMIWNNVLTPGIMVSPAEANSNIVTMDTYNNASPAKAVNPASAQWDPAFSADFTAGQGNTSYAHSQPSGQLVSPDPKLKGAPSGRLADWRDTYEATTAIISFRAPQFQADTAAGPNTVSAVFANPASISMSAFGYGREWRGSIAFNDNHVEFNTIASGTPHTTSKTYRTAAGKQIADSIFFNESDDAAQTNNFLGIFITAGEKPADFKPIWD